MASPNRDFPSNAILWLKDKVTEDKKYLSSILNQSHYVHYNQLFTSELNVNNVEHRKIMVVKLWAELCRLSSRFSNNEEGKNADDLLQYFLNTWNKEKKEFIKNREKVGGLDWFKNKLKDLLNCEFNITDYDLFLRDSFNLFNSQLEENNANPCDIFDQLAPALISSFDTFQAIIQERKEVSFQSMASFERYQMENVGINNARYYAGDSDDDDDIKSNNVQSNGLEIKFEDLMREVNNRICSICLIEYSAKYNNKILNCGHMFHAKCINQWKHSCPICRSTEINPK